MKYLVEYGFTDEEINQFVVDVPPMLLEALMNSYKVVSKNIIALRDLGVTNYKDIFLKFYDMFLMDNSNFVNIFNKYDQEDLVEKLEKNMDIVEFL